MMPTPCSLTSSLALLVLLGTVRAGPFSPRFNITRPGPRPPPQPGGHTAEPGVGSPSAQLYEHTVEGGEKQVVFTHRINLPPSAGCGCPPGTEPPAPASEVQSLKVRLEILEELVQGLKEQCTGGCCPVTAKAGTGQTDTRSLCSLHGVFDLSRCACSCEPGWGGPTCSDPTDAPVSPSSSPSCPDDCNDQGRCVRGRCECFPGYTGPSCSWPSCPGDCHGRGRCVQGVCVCRPGFSGADCSLRACPRGCSQKGRCEDGRCVCNPGYTGDDCGVKSCPRDCSQRGRCENGRCVCNPGYTGDDCGARSCPRGCSQKGRCEDGRCVCEPGYTGADCGSRSCPWDCGEGGRCVDGRCVCWPGYAGDDCSRRTCPRDCHGRGRCEDGECLCDAGYSGDDCGVRSCPGDCSQRGRCEDGRCVCWPGYTGPDCGAKSCPRDCRGRGRCEAGVCVCHPGYGGDDCGVRSCPGDCRGRGRCESGRCVCWPGYTGRDCGVRACPGDCRGRGRCVDGRCICNPGFAGDDCGSRRCPGDCRGRGRCEDGVCVCDAGYQGEDCGARSCPGGCRGRGQCLDGRCVCDDGYEGEDCGVRRCPRDCSQRGVCQDGVCACWEGYAGEDCGLRTCPSNCHGRGRCEEGRCVCDSGYTGPTCGVRTCPSDCRGHGRCVQGVCVCHPGYSGPDCGQDEPPASACPGGCGPRELCREGRCVCVEGFRGPDCAIQTCPADCLGRGECLEGSCVCQEGYAGEDCSEEIPAIENMRMHLLEETTVRTEWTRGPGTVDAYEIQFIPMFSLLQTEGMSPPFTARVPSSASAYDQRGLAPGQEYQVTVRALRGTSWGPPASKTITTMIDGPQDLRVVAVTPTTLDLSWLRPQAEVDRFVVSYVSAGNQRVRLEVPPEADRALLTDLMPGVEYVVTVTAERGPAVSYPASIRANTAPGHYSYPEVRPPPPSPQPRPGPQPSPPLLPPRPRRPSRPAEEVGPESRLPPSPPQPPRRPWGNLTAELGRFRGSVQDLERHLRARGYPLRANQTYTAVARHIHEYLLRRQAAPPAPPPRRPHPTASPNAGARKRDSSQGSYDRGTVPRHPKPEVLGFSADGTLLVSLDGLRGHFERMVLRWRPELPADGPGGELTVPGTSRTASLPNLKPSTTYHVEVHGVRAGQTSKSYAFVTTTGSSPTGFLGATDEPPPSGPSTTQGAQAPTLQHRPQELGELRVLGRDMTGRLHVTWTAQPDTFAHFQLTLQVPEGSWVHEELLPGDVHEALVPSPPPGVAYELTLHGVLPSGEPSSPLTYHGIKEKPEKPEKPLTLPRLGELTVTDAASSSLTLHWTVSEGEFDSFVIQYKDRDGPQVVPVEGSQREALITNLELNRKYKFVLYGMVGKKKHGPLVAEAKIVPQSDPISETSPRLGKLWVTDPTPDSLHLSWTVPEGQFDSFLVQYRGKDGQPQVIPVEGPERSATVSQLAPDHKYRFTLFGIANRKRHGPLMAEGTTAPEKKPGHPEPLEQPLLGKLTVNGATPDSLVLSWTVDQGSFDSFMVQYKDAQGQPQAVPVRGHENTVTIRGLESNRKYKMNLYGLHGRHRVGPVSVVASTAPQEVMETPTEPPSTEAPEPPEEPLLGKLTVTGSSQDSLSLSWTVPQGHFDRFLVQYKNGDGQPKVVRVPGTQDWVTISGLEPDHKYKVNLYGFHNGQRVGPISATGVTATEEKTPTETEVTPTEPPSTEAPESPEEPLLGELTVTGSSQDSLSLSWTVPQGHFDRFLVQYKNGDGQPKVVRVPGTQDWVTISGLEPDHKYKVNLYGFHNGQRVGPISATGVTATEEKTPTETEVTPTEPPSTEAPESPEEPLLGELTVTGSSQDSLSLSWTVPQGHFDRFLVQYKNGDGQPKVVRVPGTQDWVTISGLEPDHKYKMNLYGFHNGQRVGPISAFGVTDAVEETPTPTEPPSTEAPEPTVEPLLGELTVTGSSQDSLSLSWTVPQGHFDSFTIQYKDRDGQPQVVRVGGEEREVTVQGLDAGRKYKMHLYGLHGGQRVGPASTVGVTEDEPSPVTTPPLEPRLGQLTVTSVTPSSVGLSWTVPEGKFDSFVVQYKGKDGQPQMVPVSKDQLEVTIPGLEPARKYKMNLYGLQSGQRVGPLSVVAMTAPLPTVPATEPPQEPQLGDLTVTDVTPDSVGLLWTVPGGEFDSFVVQYKDKDGQPQVVPMAADQREATIPGLEPNKKYKFLLFGIKDGKRSSPLSVEAKTVASPGTTPRLGELWVTDPTPDSLHLSWTVPEGHFDSFVVQFKDRDGPRLVPVEGQERSVTITPLDANRKYRFLLYGLLGKKRYGPLTADGTTENRGSQDDTGIKRLPKPRLGEELQVTSVTPDSVDLSWTVTEGHFDSFVVQYKDKDGQPQVVPVEGSLREVRVPDLDPGRRYKLLLYGLHQGKRVGPLSTTAVTVLREEEDEPSEPPTISSEPPFKPLLGELTVTGSSQDSLSLSWTIPEGHFDSFVIQYKNGDEQPKIVQVPGHQNWVTISGLEPDHKYKVNLYGFYSDQRVGPISAVGVTDAVEETPIPTEPPSTEAPEPPEEPLLGELTVSGSSQDSLSLSWTVPQGHFDSFTIQYKDKDGQPQVVRVRGEEREVTVRGLDAGRKYKMHLYGLHGGQRVGPVSTVGVTEPEGEPTSPPVKPLLGELTVTGSSQDSLSLSWTVPQGQFDHFLVQYKNGDGQPKVLRVPGTQDWVTISGLEPDHKYKMNLYGFHGDQREGPISTVGVTGKDEEMTPFPTDGPTTTPEPPFKPHLGELTVTGSSQDSLSLSWTVPQGHFDRFLVQYKNGDGQPKVVRVPGTQDWVTISGLEPDHKYKVNLYGFHNGQRVGPISAIGVTDAVEETPTLTEPLSTEAPEPSEEPLLGELTVTGSSQDSLSLSWTVPQGQFDRFLVQYKNGDGQPKVVRVPGTQDWVTISGLEPDHKYKVNLYGFHNGQRVGPISATGVTATEEKTPTETEVTPTEPPSTEAPESPEEPLLGELTVTGSSQDSLSLSWTVPQGHFDRFLVQYKNGDGQPKVVRVPGTQDWVTISGLEPDHKYKVNLYGFHNGQRVGPISAFGVTDAVEETPTPTEPPSTEAPDPPVEPLLGELTVTGSSQDSLSLSWTVPQGHFDSFTIQYKDRDGQPQVVRVGGEEREVTVRGLDAGRKYKMHLYGLHGGQRVGPVSTVGVTDAVEETPTPTEPPSTEAPEPTVEPLLGELTVTESSQDSLSLSWTVPQGHFDSFTIQYKDRDGQPQVVRVGGEEREVTVQGLDAGRKYKMHLYGLHGGQRVGPVSTVGVTVAHDIVEKTPTPTEPPSTEAPESPEEPLLGELTVTGSSQDSLSLSWTVPQGQFDRFLVQYKNGDGHPKVVRVPGTQDWVTISGLEPDHKYKVNLYGFHNGQHVGPISAFGVTDAVEETPTPTEPPSTETPEPPEESLLGELTVTGSSQDSLSLSWTVPQGHFDSFTIQYKDRDGQPQVVRVGGEEREVTVQGLDAGRKYKMHLYGLHGGQRVGPVSTVGVTDSETVTTQVSPTTTSEPPFKTLLGELTITDTTPDSLSLSWTITEGQFDRFLVQYKNGDGQPKVVRVPGTQDWVTITGLEPDHKYKVNLYGFHNGQRVGPISVFGVTDAVEETPIPTEPPSTEAPEPPEESLLGELTVTGSSQDSLSLSWTVPQGHFDSFTIQYKDKDGQPQVVRVGGEEREVTVRGLDAGHKYKMHLYGLHGGQRVGPVSTVGLTASLPTEPPVALSLGELTVVSVASDTVHLSWTVAQGPFDSFLVQYKDSQGQPQAVPVDGSLREVIVSGLDPARKYKFLLFGLQDEKKHGPVSTEAKTLPDKKPSPRLGDLTVTDVTPDSVGLLWTVPEGEFDSFVVQYKDKDRQPQVVPVAADQRKVTIPGLEPKKKYKFLLYGLAGRKRLGPVSAEGTTAPLEKELPPLPRLGELTLTDETPDSIHLSWTVAQGPFDSFVVQYRGTDGQPRAVPVAADEREVTIEGLEAGKKYKFLLFGLFRGQRLGPISGLGATASAEDTPIPGIPATEAPEGPRLGVLTVNSVAPDALRLSWSVAQGVFESFVIQYRDTDGKSQALLVDGDQSTVLVSSLEPSTPYMFSLYGLHGGKRLGPISAEGITGPAPPAGEIPGEPRPRLSQLSVTDVTTSSLRLNWEAPPGAFDSFLLRFGVPSQSSLEPYPRPLLQRELTVPGSRRSAAIRDLRPGTLYNLTLYGLRGPHKADSIQGSARTLSPVLESPHDLQFSEIGETSAKVSWTPPPSRVDSFKVSYQLADGGEPQSVRVDSRAQTQTLKGLAPGTRYEVTVVSIRGFEESEPLTGFFTTVSDGPTKLQALNLTEGSTVLHWDPPQNPVDTYDVQVTAPEAPSLQASAPGSAVDYPLSGLELHTNYTAMVRGLRGSNFTSPANITFTTGLEAPRDLEAKEVTPRTALLTWTEPPDPPTGYLLSFNTPGEQTQEILLPGGVTSHRLLGLFPSTTYNAFLRAVWGESFSPPMPTSFTTGGLRIPFPRDCGEEMQNGISTSRTTTIFLNGNRERPLDVFCDMETDGGGWLVFQRRMDGKTDFWRDWEDYAHGFGNISREFWLGNEALHSLTSSGDYSLRVDLRAGDEAVFAHYDSFRVDSAAKYYQLHLEGYHGTAGDSMTYHSGSVFSARDRDPNNLLISCAVSYRGAWWYRNCHYANLNGLYGSTVDHQGVSWYYWKGFGFSVPFTEMKLRPRNYHPPAWGG
ncbi:tenascin-X isoform X4 [Erinaceus europaeus]|uniref:Tenascin-X isoform X4 n=1 Tax=Erinaceus europaeus TaxID=9365 RepID=A0ABM3X9J2_ERIEU|nr:tenascin-X isoform X4 [Erinaceus europaeus]